MITTTLRRTLLRSTASAPLARSRPCLSCAKRQFATSPPSAPHSATSPAASMLGALTGELDKLAPRFELHASQIRILQAPGEFYETLKERISKAERRIFLSTLYIGKTEHELISILRAALLRSPTLHVSILSDALRGTRESPHPSCASLLAPLVAEFGADRVDIRMYHTPNLRGLRKKVVPKRLNEGWGLQHMKLYGVDDEIIISGANLSDDYFTNRQDRYHVFSCPRLTDYFSRIHNAVCSISYQVLPAPADQGGFTLEWPESNPAPQPTEEPTAFKTAATAILAPLIRPLVAAKAPSTTGPRTFVYPLAQFTPLLYPTDTSTEHPGLSAVLRLLSRDDWASSKWMFTAGYFNIHSQLKQLLLASKSVQGTVVTAAPEANGFYGSKGVSNMLPPAYTLLARRFLGDVVKMGKEQQIELREWRKGTIGKDPDAWTYHAKGIWVTLPNEQNPSITLVGSSNYTKRSYSLDLEINALVVTEDESLKKQLRGEVEWLQEKSKKVTMEDFERTERRVSLKVRLALWLVGVLGGQL
ncbi:CDP-diacylglycerol--glycerol-3-phosphate 3-phosphatidyltransferase [Maublancomyces gigas]|uniref:CDP-diacylglycerol--glycerol-3-phosphate 3-phosphatidyltransferase n=1 Tax=Discina gigas TaxID=1032678 RepID=A0ABR3GMU8_9PEZI